MSEFTFGGYAEAEVVKAVHEDVEMVTVTVRVPETFQEFSYTKEEWDQAVTNDAVVYLMDRDLSDLDISKEVYGPDGQQVSAW